MQKVVICIPGEKWHHTMGRSLIVLLSELAKAGWETLIVDAYGANIFECRRDLLGIPKDALNHKPFRDEEYSHILFIDTDIVFSPYHFERLYKRDVDIVAGFYLMTDAVNYSAAVDFIPSNGSNRYITREDLKDKSELIPLDWAGMGFMLVKQGVFEALGYPWFVEVPIKTRVFEERSSEDAGFCLRAKEKGFITYGDPAVKLTHLKTRGLI